MKLDISLHCHNAGDILFDGLYTHRVVELIDCLLEAKLEQLVFRFGKLLIVRMSDSVFNRNNYSLLHLVAGNYTNAGFSEVSFHSLSASLSQALVP